MPTGPDVVIVGGGLAGLAAARRLHRAGVPWRLVEAGDRLGGRVATDRLDGYLLPAASPPQKHLRKPVALGDGLYVAGDHRDSPSIQGALASGWRAAGTLLRDLRP
ncbi:hypothetical protein GCM10017556_10420 [Micromonospora sagamiensis]|uniref:Putative NAD(P)-binding protein n=1 Tax=Micromonospora sagamiensis TaxID=47875 RepID=A0A562WC09_9ACTN|nr:FAD-dependent oxidoreductase [Micromonospora sagamiensis]TWJ27810.1 putative NAD(P)-binding protein [Micromonospora sagamiensis]BCL13303.1 hypothetical protein GCM10017556_10420 [Micromonospora sagamiensis]